jgi:hypothetical protein
VGERERRSYGLQCWPRLEESIALAQSCWHYRQPRNQCSLEVVGFELVAWVHCRDWEGEGADMEHDWQESAELGDLDHRH